MRRSYKKTPEKVPKATAWFLVIAGLIMGTVFSFGMHHWESSVSKEEAIYGESVFDSYKEIRSIHELKEVRVVFRDRDPLFIDGACCNHAVLEKMANLEAGTLLCFYVHPNSSTLLEIKVGDTEILMFDDAVKCLSAEVSAFLFLGIFMYLLADYGLFKIIRRETY